jgi:hypothetical protein
MGCHVKYRNFKSMTKIFLSSLQKTTPAKALTALQGLVFSV